LYRNYKLEPIIEKYADKHNINDCENWNDMRKRQRENSKKVNGDPIDNIKKYNIKTIEYDKKNKLNLRIFPSNKPDGICIFIHGGGLCIGEYDIQDKTLNEFKNNINQTIVSIQYRLAGNKEVPPVTDSKSIPIPNNDCYNAIEYILNNISIIDNKLNKNSKVTITGNSAGAQLAMASIINSTKIRGYCPFTRASFLFCAFVPFSNGYKCSDSMKSDKMIGWEHGKKEYKLLTIKLMSRFQHAYSNNFSNPHGRGRVNMSLAYVRNLCPAQFIVGTNDMMLRSNISTYSQWRLADNEGQLIVVKGVPHAFNGFPIRITKKAFSFQYDFLKDNEKKIKKTKYLLKSKKTNKWPANSSFPDIWPYFI
jgi:acetyl esterase/lipase